MTRATELSAIVGTELSSAVLAILEHGESARKLIDDAQRDATSAEDESDRIRARGQVATLGAAYARAQRDALALALAERDAAKRPQAPNLRGLSR